MIKNEFSIETLKEDIFAQTYSGMCRKDDQHVYFDGLKGDVLLNFNGYLSSLTGDQTIANKQLHNKIVSFAPKDNIDSDRYILIKQLSIDEFLNEFKIQAKNTEPYKSYANTFQEKILKQFLSVDRTDNNKYTREIENLFFDVFAKKYGNSSPNVMKLFEDYFVKTCRSLASAWISNNVLKNNINSSIDIAVNEIIKLNKYGNIDEANASFRHLLENIKGNTKLLRDIKYYFNIGKIFNIYFFEDNSLSTDDLQIVAELSYYFISKAMQYQMSPDCLLQRINILYNGEDFIKYAIQKSYDIKVDLLSRIGSPHMVKHELRDKLAKARIVDFFHDDFRFINTRIFIEEKEKYLSLIHEGYFEPLLDINEVIEDGNNIHSKLFNFIENKINSNDL